MLPFCIDILIIYMNRLLCRWGMSKATLLSVKRLKSSPPRYLNPLNDHYIQPVWFLRIKVYGITRSNILDDPTRSKLMGAANI